MLANTAVVLNYLLPVAYLSAVVAYLVFFIRPGQHRVWLHTSLLAALAVHVATVVVRWIGADHIPLSSSYEAITFFTLSVTLVYAYLELRVGLQTVGLFVVSVGLIFQTLAATRYTTFGTISPELDSGWFAIHAGATILSFSSFALSGVMSALYLLLYKEIHAGRPGYIFRRIPSLEALDEMSYRAIRLGFLLLTIGLATGMLWSNAVWGRPWTWEPKHCSSLTTWLMYGAYLWLRFRGGWRGKRVAIFSLVGFLLLIFTFVIVDIIFRSVHSFP